MPHAKHVLTTCQSNTIMHPARCLLIGVVVVYEVLIRLRRNSVTCYKLQTTYFDVASLAGINTYRQAMRHIPFNRYLPGQLLVPSMQPVL